jgi:predicted P-loop ATPase
MAETEFQNQNTTPQLPVQSGTEASDLLNQADEVMPSAENPEEITVKLPAIVVIERYLGQHYQFIFNELTSRIEFKPIAAANFELLNDYKLNSIYRDLKLNRIKTSVSELRAIINSDFVPVFNPFKAYFENLPQWDGHTDYIAQLAATVSTTNDQLWEKCLRKWLVAMVGSAIQEEIVNHTVVVFSGPQGIGKSTWILNLVPTELKNYVFSGTINPSSKDTLVQISECLLINMDELETMSKAQIGELKEMVTKAAVRIRRAYGLHVENMPRRASFSGSVNDKEFLNDTTGNRRFLCFEVTNIQYNHGVSMDQVFSQAYALFRTGFQFWFDGTEIQEIATNNEQFQSVPFEEELLLAHYEPVSKEDATLFLSTTDIASNLAEHRKFNITASTKLNLGRALHKHQFVRVKKKGRYVFAVKPKTLNLSVQLAAAAQETNN